MPRSVPTLIEALLAAGRWPDPDLVDELLACGREAEGEIAHLLRQDLRRRREESALPVLIGLAGEVGGSDLARDLVVLYRRYDDDTLEHVNAALVRLGPEALPPVLELAGDRSVRWYGRAMAAAAAVKLARHDPPAKERVGSELRHMLSALTSRGELSDSDQLLAASLVWGLASLPDPQAEPAIAQAFGARIITERSVTPDTVAEAFRRAGARGPGETVSFGRAYRERFLKMKDEAPGEPLRSGKRKKEEKERETETVKGAGREEAEKETEKKAGKAQAEKGKAAERETDREADGGAFAAAGAAAAGGRPGRNDPCWCGSGKKYKRCHLDKD